MTIPINTYTYAPFLLYKLSKLFYLPNRPVKRYWAQFCANILESELPVESLTHLRRTDSYYLKSLDNSIFRKRGVRLLYIIYQVL